MATLTQTPTYMIGITEAIGVMSLGATATPLINAVPQQTPSQKESWTTS